jgi:hypothetical protein
VCLRLILFTFFQQVLRCLYQVPAFLGRFFDLGLAKEKLVNYLYPD